MRYSITNFDQQKDQKCYLKDMNEDDSDINNQDIPKERN